MDWNPHFYFHLKLFSYLKLSNSFQDFGTERTASSTDVASMKEALSQVHFNKEAISFAVTSYLQNSCLSM